MSSAVSVLPETMGMCSNCGERPSRSRGRCERCYHYLNRHGVDRPLGLTEGELKSASLRKPHRPCVACGTVTRLEAIGRCNLCYIYFRRLGRDRPEHLIRRKEWKAKGLRWCPSCEAPRPFAEFDKKGGSQHGLQSYCRACSAAKSIAMARRKRRTDPEWRQRHIDFAVEAGRKRRMGKLSQPYEAVSIEYLVERDGGVCQLCKKRVSRDQATMDHIIPISKGGPHLKSNLQLAHLSCNSKKGNREWKQGEQLRVVG